MYPCPNCRAGLRFDIPTQKLKCDHCDSSFDPYTIGREKDAVEHDTYEATVFTCPQCGGELISNDETVATFCSYCGGTTILDSHIANEKRPEFIITFKKSKEECKQAFQKAVKKALFAPKEYKDPELIEKFRGIYMPYWAYDFETNGHVSFEGKTSHRSGDYIIEDTYLIHGPANGEAEGITYDATSTFSDDISASIAPYNIKEKQNFTPSILSGFYADTNDVDKSLYSDDASEMVSRYNQTEILASRPAKGKSVDAKNKDSIKKQLTPDIKGAGLAFLPVWFLAYKTKDKRVAYAVVNGQTGKALVDIPVDKKKFGIVGGIIAVVLFAILCLAQIKLDLVLTPYMILAISIFLSVVMFFMSSSQLATLRKRETLEDDQGMMYRKKLEEMKAAERNEINADQLEQASQSQKNDYIRSDSLALRCAASVNDGSAFAGNKSKSLGCGLLIGLAIVTAAIMYGTLGMLPRFIKAFFGSYSDFAYIVVLIIITVPLYFAWRNALATGSVFKRPDKTNLTGGAKLIKPVIAIIIAAAIMILKPVHDMFYYGAAIVCIVMLILTEFQIIDQHNELTTRKPPQLGKRGGDENA